MTTNFDRQDYFQKECQPLLEQLQKLCTVARIPFFYTACVKNDEEGSEYVSEGVLTGSTRIELADDRIKRHLLVNLGFDVIPKKSDIEIQMDDPEEL